MSHYILVDGSFYEEGGRQKFIADVKTLLDGGYSLGGFTKDSYYVTQVMYKTSQPPLQSILESLDHTLKYAPIGLSLGTAAPEVFAAQARVNGSHGGRRITNSSRPRRARRHSVSRTRKARSRRHSRILK